MRLPFKESLSIVIIIAVVTYLLRALPFTVFRSEESMPKAIHYLGKVLPFAVIAMLVVFCFKDLDPTPGTVGANALAVAFVVVAHRKFHNMLLSIGGGTVLYMVLLRFWT